MRIMFHLVVIVIANSLCGCMPASTAVSSVGARMLYGQTEYNPSAKVVDIEIRDTALIMNPDSKPPLLPFSSLVTDGNGEIVDIIRLNYDDINWTDYKDGMQRGELISTVENIDKKFEVRLEKHNTNLIIEHRYRRWYGYPAQGLLVVTIPIEAVFNVFLVSSYLYVMTGG